MYEVLVALIGRFRAQCLGLAPGPLILARRNRFSWRENRAQKYLDTFGLFDILDFFYRITGLTGDRLLGAEPVDPWRAVIGPVEGGR
jgi:hypothetical protein